MINEMACLGQQIVPGLGLLAQRIPLPRKLRQRSRLNVDNKQIHTITHHSASITNKHNLTSTECYCPTEIKAFAFGMF